MTTSRFATATMVKDLGQGQFEADLDPDFSVAGKVNGGYLLAVLFRAVTAHAEASGSPAGHPRAATVHYLRSADAGPAQLQVEVLRAGRRTGQVRAQLWQDDQLQAEALFTLAEPTADEPAPDGSPADGMTADEPAAVRTGAHWSDEPPVGLPDEQDCFPMPVQPPGARFRVPLMGVVEERLDPAVLSFALGRPTGAGQLRGWVRIPDEDPLDAAGLMLVADALPPAVFDLGHTGWVPTLSLTVHLLGSPAPGPVRVRQQVHGMHGGLLSQVCDIWDSEGALVTHATQLARLPR